MSPVCWCNAGRDGWGKGEGRAAAGGGWHAQHAGCTGSGALMAGCAGKPHSHPLPQVPCPSRYASLPRDPPFPPVCRTAPHPPPPYHTCEARSHSATVLHSLNTGGADGSSGGSGSPRRWHVAVQSSPPCRASSASRIRSEVVPLSSISTPRTCGVKGWGVWGGGVGSDTACSCPGMHLWRGSFVRQRRGGLR